jgi:hypothetical protein
MTSRISQAIQPLSATLAVSLADELDPQVLRAEAGRENVRWMNPNKQSGAVMGDFEGPARD